MYVFKPKIQYNSSTTAGYRISLSVTITNSYAKLADQMIKHWESLQVTQTLDMYGKTPP
jgi:hypothetical protein